MTNRRILYFGVALYVVALFLPGLVSTPSPYGDYSICGVAKAPDATCVSNRLRTFFNFGREIPIECVSPRSGSPLIVSGYRYIMDKTAVAEYCKNSNEVSLGTVSGLTLLFIGWMGVFAPWFNFAWFANPFGALALWASFYKKHPLGLALSGPAFLLSLQSYEMKMKEYPLDEGGVKKLLIDHVGTGCYLWQFSIACLVLFCIRGIRNKSLE